MKHWTVIGLVVVVGTLGGAGCTTSSNPSSSSDDGGTTTTGDSATPASGSDSGGTSPGSDAATAGNDASQPTGDDGGGTTVGNDCTPLNGNWTATQVQCNGSTVTLPAGFSWTATINGTQGSFTETISGCGLTSSGTVSCSSGDLLVFPQTSTCSPAGCSPFAAQCAAGDTSEQVWAVSSVSATSFLLTSQDEPDGAPSPIKTCTAMGKQNPVQVTWTKQ
jgi:hypothetical protein